MASQERKHQYYCSYDFSSRAFLMSTSCITTYAHSAIFPSSQYYLNKWKPFLKHSLMDLLIEGQLHIFLSSLFL